MIVVTILKSQFIYIFVRLLLVFFFFFFGGILGRQWATKYHCKSILMVKVLHEEVVKWRIERGEKSYFHEFFLLFLSRARTLCIISQDFSYNAQMNIYFYCFILHNSILPMHFSPLHSLCLAGTRNLLDHLKNSFFFCCFHFVAFQ